MIAAHFGLDNFYNQLITTYPYMSKGLYNDMLDYKKNPLTCARGKSKKKLKGELRMCFIIHWFFIISPRNNYKAIRRRCVI